MKENKPTTVDEYIKSFPKDVQNVLNEMRSIILDALPDATEALKWGQPAFSYDTIMVSYAAHKHKANLYVTPSTLRAMKDILVEYETGKGSIQFPYEKPLPHELIRKITKYRLKEYKEQGIKWM